MKINLSLNQKSIKNAINKITEYRDSLPEKCRQFSDELVNIGIDTAIEKTGNSTFSKYVTFSKKVETEDGKEITLLVAHSQRIMSVWKTQDEVRQVEISPLLMLEVGSGNYADNPLEIPNAGQGALNTYGHAFDEDGWWFQTLEGKWIHSKGYAPHAPMYSALMEMKDEIETVAKRVFGNG